MKDRRLVIAHLSDLHLSQFGEQVTATALLQGQLPSKGLLTSIEWEDIEKIGDWRLQRWSRFRRFATQSVGLRLLDAHGARHGGAVVPHGPGLARRVDEALERLRALVRVRSRAAVESLNSDWLDPEELEHLLALDPANTNLRFLEVVAAVREIGPDVIVLTGDVTDDGVGHELVLRAFADYIAAGRFFAVAGNHDLSAVPPGTSVNTTLESKAARWRWFVGRAGLNEGNHGASSVVIDDVLLLGLNSSIVPSRVPWSARGRVGKNQLVEAAHHIERVSSPRARICCLHHHVAHLRLGPISRTDPVQFAMKLRDAADVVHVLKSSGFSAVLNGHRHHGYHVQEAELPHVVSSPSSTLGCRASKARYLWLISINDSVLRVDRHYLSGSGYKV